VCYWRDSSLICESDMVSGSILIVVNDLDSRTNKSLVSIGQ